MQFNLRVCSRHLLYARTSIQFEDTVVARNLPALANAVTITVRFANNVVGGTQFIDLARFFGIQ